jgi:hypothetical protein
LRSSRTSLSSEGIGVGEVSLNVERCMLEVAMYRETGRGRCVMEAAIHDGGFGA